MNRGILFLSLAVAIVASDSIIFFADVKSRPFYSNSIIVANASIAVALALIIAYREKLEGPHGKAHEALAIGLSLWISADIVWAFYELVLEIAPPVPSPADLLWFVGYGFLAYNLFSMYKELLKKVGRAALAVTITGNVLFLVYIIFLTFGLSELSTLRGGCNVRDHGFLSYS